MPKNKIKTKSNLGYALKKASEKKRDSNYNMDMIPGEQKLQSITERSTLNDFLSTAITANRDFTAKKDQISIVYPDKPPEIENLNLSKISGVLPIPRRPSWTIETTTEELDKAEKDCFIKWRRSLATIENDSSVTITPYEKNIEVWRQLWRVLERSDIIVMICDARNPLLFFSNDLKNYVKDLNKSFIILLNKADYLSEYQRIKWINYFKSINQECIFYSATNNDEKNINIDSFHYNFNIISSSNLLKFFKKLASSLFSNKSDHTIGFVGYPNVGKSSTINKLKGQKKTAVGNTPGKTKHFQTIIFEDINICLCDCPGLVFPSMAISKADLFCNGIISIDHLREYNTPISLLLQRISAEQLKNVYKGLKLPVIVNVHSLLQSFASMKGYTSTKTGVLDENRAARILLKDLINGKLLHVEHPPNLSDNEIIEFHKDTKYIKNDINNDKYVNVLLPAYQNPNSSSQSEEILQQYSHQEMKNWITSNISDPTYSRRKKEQSKIPIKKIVKSRKREKKK